MNRRTPLRSAPGLRALVAAALGAVILGSLALRPGSSAADPAASASASASAAASSATPSAGAAAPTSPDAGPPLPRFDAEPFSDEKTPRPSPDEWKPVEPVALTDPLPSNCRAYRLREWVRIRCSPVGTSMIALLGGARGDVFLFIDPPAEQGAGVPTGGEVMFPVRRGDARVFEWSTFGEAYEGPGFPEVAFVISEAWPPGDAGPTIIAR